jgi:dTDP-4-amino-4,6-dideoxygalactose transaminase
MYIIGKEEAEAARRVIESGQLFRYRGGEGGEVDMFEQEWAEKVGAEHCLAVTSGTAALECALAGMGVGPGDEVIVPAYTWLATATSALNVGAIPMLADVDESLTLDPKDVERKITERTKVICPVHMMGLPSNMDGIIAVAKKHGIAVLEDSCQADGGSYKGKRLGTHGIAGAFSFNLFKIIACGEAGALVTDDQTVFDRATVYHDAGCNFRDHAQAMSVPIFVGRNFRLNEILGAILRVQVGRLDGILETLRSEKRKMVQELASVSAFSLSPVNDPDGDCAVVLGLLFETCDAARKLMAGMKDEGITLESPIDSGRHVYTNWTPLVEKRGSHHEDLNPYAQCGYEVDYSPDVCRTTLDNLARTVYVPTAVDRSEQELMALVDKIKKVAGS